MFHNDGGNLLADGDDRVERCHRILENGCDSSAADTGPVLCIFKFCKVDNAGTVDAFFVLVKEPDAESDIIEYIGSCCVIVKVETVFIALRTTFTRSLIALMRFATLYLPTDR